MTKRLAARFLMITLTTSLMACGESQHLGGVEQLPDDEMTEQQALETELAEKSTPDADVQQMTEPVFSLSERQQILSKYSHLDPNHLVPSQLLAKAVEYFEANQSRFANKNYISVIDFSKRSTKSRFWIVDLKSGAVWAIHTAHGKNSDTNNDGYAESFSNTSGSNKSSLGFYKVAETYNGTHGLSIRMDGLSSTNSNARSRAIVIHGASYVREQSVVQGRSWGCPAVANANRDEVVRRLKGGSLLYVGLSGVR